EIPMLAAGGHIGQSGLSIVGEAGPELLNLPRGATVAPLGAMGGAGGGQPIVINWSSLARPSDSEIREVASLLDRELGRLALGRG
ncbi:MAG TPA: hypothetical protein VD902_11420, partial [Symbiobacteriaceae bacterium]|nr:hypothetical protein [Symbiobacteriaceae bacterium]